MPTGKVWNHSSAKEPFCHEKAKTKIHNLRDYHEAQGGKCGRKIEQHGFEAVELVKEIPIRSEHYHLTRQSSAAASESAAGNLWQYFNHEKEGNKPARRRLQRLDDM